MEPLSGIADYEFIRVIGEGAHGTFYLARPPERIGAEQDFVAVKVLNLGSSTDAFRRMTRELRVFASVPSPFLVHLYDAGRYLDTFYYAMEYYELGSLAAPSRALSRDEVLRAVADAARAAHDLHEAGVAHRGIKPANVLVHENGAKLSDLGLAQILAPGQTVTGLQGLGSIEYVDQEVLRGEPTSRSSDIWALGATLHRALTGTGLYGELPTGQTIAALRQVLDRAPMIDPALPPDIAEIIAACINPDPSARPATAEDLAIRIDALTSYS